MSRKRILVIDDEDSVLKDYLLILSPNEREEGMDELKARKAALKAELFGDVTEREESFQECYRLETAQQGEEGFLKIKDACERGSPFALAFIDIRMPPGWDGLDTARKIREIDPEIEIVLVTAFSDKDRKKIVESVGAPEKLLYLKKPFDPDEIRQLALSLTRKWDLERKTKKHMEYLEQLLLSVRRLKTLSISSVRDVLEAILREVLDFVGAHKGFIAALDKGAVCVEVTSEKIWPEDTEFVHGAISGQLAVITDICWVDGIMVFPLNDVQGSHFVLVLDLEPPVEESKMKLLRLLLETSSEVLTSVRKQEQYMRNERIAAIGQIAAGIIHEINNPLCAVLGAADLCEASLERLGDLQDSSESINQIICYHRIIHEGIERVRTLTKSIGSLSKGCDRFEPALQDVGEALEDTLVLAANALKRGIRVHRQWERPLMAWCDLNGLKQVFLNLILNAVHAMSGSGDLWIMANQEKDHLHVAIKDSGPGVPSHLRDRVFEPFFTTKDDGTGLGLSIVKGIVDRHKGAVWVESQPGEGATFHVALASRGF